MQFPITSVSDLGLALRAVRRSSKLRLDDMADTAGVSKQFASDVELGKETVRMGLVFKLLAELGLKLSVDVPEQATPELHRLRGELALAKAVQKPKRKTSTASAAIARDER